MLMLFAQHFQPMRGAASIDLVVADRHPYARNLWRSGFLPGPAQTGVHIRSGERSFNQYAWHITSGDRDV
jgi:hypothetical protein